MIYQYGSNVNIQNVKKKFIMCRVLDGGGGGLTSYPCYTQFQSGKTGRPHHI